MHWVIIKGYDINLISNKFTLFPINYNFDKFAAVNSQFFIGRFLLNLPQLILRFLLDDF